MFVAQRTRVTHIPCLTRLQQHPLTPNTTFVSFCHRARGIHLRTGGQKGNARCSRERPSSSLSCRCSANCALVAALVLNPPISIQQKQKKKQQQLLPLLLVHNSIKTRQRSATTTERSRTRRVQMGLHSFLDSVHVHNDAAAGRDGEHGIGLFAHVCFVCCDLCVFALGLEQLETDVQTLWVHVQTPKLPSRRAMRWWTTLPRKSRAKRVKFEC